MYAIRSYYAPPPAAQPNGTRRLVGFGWWCWWWGALIEELDGPRAERLRAEGTLAGGMIPKIDACFLV